MIKILAYLNEFFLYMCLWLGFLTSTFYFLGLLLKAWDFFVNSKNNFLEWLKTWKCKQYIQENYKKALFMEDLLSQALNNISDKEVHERISRKLEELNACSK